MIIPVLGLINIAAFYLYWLDKRNARKGRWRIPEKTLLGVALCGGSIGALLGMYVCRHKTRHLKFVLLIPIFLLIHIGIILLFYM